jgi:eukaryotic-like serine/threonine-protein kinase
MASIIGTNIGRYQITELLGEGGMATVYKAHDTRLERDVAIKIIRRGAFPPEQLERILPRFEREAKSLGRLSHPNIVKVYDYGEYKGAPYLVLEYIPGGTLKQKMVGLGKPMAWQEAAAILMPIARALHFAHAQGIIHRDVKPANILITLSGEAMLSDFGIAKLLEDGGSTLTGSSASIGTPEYMAPEQWTGIVTPKSDLYSLGVVFYEMVAGRKPYEADTPAAILIKQVNEVIPYPSSFVPDLPMPVETLMLKMLARNPDDRYADIAEFITELEKLATSSAARGGTLSIETEAAAAPPRSSPWVPVVVLMSMLILGLGIGGGLFLLGRQGYGPFKGLATNTPTLTPRFTPTFTPSQTSLYTNTPQPTATLDSTSTSTNTPEPQKTYTSTPLAPGTTMISEKDNGVMVYVPAGNFKMGSPDYDDRALENEKPQHNVYLSAFWINKTEVTNAMYAKCVDDGICQPPFDNRSMTRANYFDNNLYLNYPVVKVNWDNAQEYCHWINGRLPTEAEWEKAARGTLGRNYPWGNELPDCTMLNFSNCIGETTEFSRYDPVGASPYGLLDMAGNVGEWVSDWYDDNYYSVSPSENPTGPASGDTRVVRGGAFNQTSNARSASRDSTGPIVRTYNIGFRCVVPAK